MLLKEQLMIAKPLPLRFFISHFVIVSTFALLGAPPTAIQTPHCQQVPHTTKNGKLLTKYDPKSSFFPIGQWGVPESRVYKGIDYRWHHLVKAGYNTVWPWAMGGYSSEEQLAQAAKHKLQVVIMRRPRGEALLRIKDSPNLFGIVWQDEPLINFGVEPEKQKPQQAEFLAYKQEVAKVAPDLPVFVNTASWMVGNGRDPWIAWHKMGDLSCHDNYVIWPETRSLNLGSYGTEKNGIADATSLAVQVTEGKKPVWLVVGAFESDTPPNSKFPFRYPTPMQLRGMVYTGIIHGATGITYYAWDSNITRFGMAPDIRTEIPGRPRASTTQAITAKALWETAAAVNHELQELTPAILSPTVGAEVGYRVSFEGTSITPSPLRTLLKNNPNGGFVLITVNMDNTVITGQFEFDRSLEEPKLMFGSKNEIPFDKKTRSFSLSYEPFQVRVIQLKSHQGNTDCK